MPFKPKKKSKYPDLRTNSNWWPTAISKWNGSAEKGC